MKKYPYFLAIVVLLASCAQEEDNIKPTTVRSRINGEELFYNAEFGFYAPARFNNIAHLNNMESNAQNAAGRVNSLTPSGGIAQTSTWIERRSNSNQSLQPQRSVSCPPGAVITGLGLLFQSSNGKVSHLVVQYQHISADGTLGAWGWQIVGQEVWGPDHDDLEHYIDPFHYLEAWITVPSYCMVTGVGIIGKYDVQRLEVSYRKFDQFTRKYSAGEWMLADGLALNKPVQIQFKLSDHTEFRDITALTGIGFGNDGGGVGVMSFEIGVFLPRPRD